MHRTGTDAAASSDQVSTESRRQDDDDFYFYYFYFWRAGASLPPTGLERLCLLRESFLFLISEGFPGTQRSFDRILLSETNLTNQFHLNVWVLKIVSSYWRFKLQSVLDVPHLHILWGRMKTKYNLIQFSVSGTVCWLLKKLHRRKNRITG